MKECPTCLQPLPKTVMGWPVPPLWSNNPPGNPSALEDEAGIDPCHNPYCEDFRTELQSLRKSVQWYRSRWKNHV